MKAQYSRYLKGLNKPPQLVETKQRLDELKHEIKEIEEPKLKGYRGDYYLSPSTKATSKADALENKINASFYQQGWKVHISADTLQDYLYCVDKVLPELQKLNITHKIVSPENLVEQNTCYQQGKIITLYPNNLMDLNKLPKDVKQFLSIENNTPILTDTQLGGKVFARYTSFARDEVINPLGMEEKIPREEGFYKPEWAPEPATLTQIFKGEAPNDKLSYLTSLQKPGVNNYNKAVDGIIATFPITNTEQLELVSTKIVDFISEEQMSYDLSLIGVSDDEIKGELNIYLDNGAGYLFNKDNYGDMAIDSEIGDFLKNTTPTFSPNDTYKYNGTPTGIKQANNAKPSQNHLSKVAQVQKLWKDFSK